MTQPHRPAASRSASRLGFARLRSALFGTTLFGAALLGGGGLLQASQEFEASALEAHLRVLASDDLKGRDTGTPENDEAARYLARVLERAGLAPAGDDGGYLQAVPLIATGMERAPTLRMFDRAGQARDLEYGKEYTVQGGDDLRARLRLLFVPDAASIPERADPALALYLATSRSEGERWLEERGHPDGAGFGALVVRGSSRARERPFRAGKRLMRGDEVPATGTPRILVNGDLIGTFDAGEVEALEIDLDVVNDALTSYNVLARIDGVGTPERPELAQEAVVFSAHFDHMGVVSAPPAAEGEAPEVDLIMNGADDDASGTACVLELARAFAAGPKPARTLLFLLATGEERGLLGTYHYIDHPVVPLERTICNLNFEMIGRPDDLVGGAGKLWLTGHERSNLFDAINANGIPIAPDGRPDQNFFWRSDNIAFALRGIVAQTFSTYDMHTDYHQVTDEWETLDYEHMAACTAAAYALSRLVADGAIDPAWHEGMKPERRAR